MKDVITSKFGAVSLMMLSLTDVKCKYKNSSFKAVKMSKQLKCHSVIFSNQLIHSHGKQPSLKKLIEHLLVMTTKMLVQRYNSYVKEYEISLFNNYSYYFYCSL